MILTPIGTMFSVWDLSFNSLSSSANSFFSLHCSVYKFFHFSHSYSLSVIASLYLTLSTSLSFLTVSISYNRAATCFLRSLASFSANLALVKLACSLVPAKLRSAFSLAIAPAFAFYESVRRVCNYVVLSNNCPTKLWDWLKSSSFWVWIFSDIFY